MKRRFLIIALCLVCAASFGQAKKGTTTKKPTTKKPNSTGNKPQTQPDTNANKQQTAAKPPVGAPPVTNPTTAAKTPATPAKPFDRPQDGYYKKNNIINAKAMPLPQLREADIVFQKRIWREFDLRDTKNQYMASPKGRLIDIIMDAVNAGELVAYDPIPTKDDPDGDAFGSPLTPEKARLKMVDSSVVNTIDKNGDKSGSKMVAGEFNPDSIVRFRIKEDYIFDKQRSVAEYRIVGIAPMIKQKIDAGAINIAVDYQPAFWIYFPDARKILATKEIVNGHNDATGLSYDDAFLKRLFFSYVVKESNDKDESIKNYAVGIDKLYESERVKKTILDWELNLWQY